jgi:hypothetical protein
MAAQRLPDWLLARIGTEPIDAYPSEASVLFASGLNWSPRPVCQSYSAYSPELDEANAARYRSPAGPEFVLFELTAIDRQHPWFVDPVTLRELFSRFEVVLKGPQFALLQRRAEPGGAGTTLLDATRTRIGERVVVPRDSNFLLAAALRLRLTAMGRLKDKLWKVYAPSVRVEFENGTEQTYEIVWRNAVSGLLLSELPASLQDVDALWDPAKRTAVTAFTVLADPADFNEEIDLTWLRTTVPAKPPER